MSATPVYAFPFPALTDTPAGPAQMQALAERIEAVLQANLALGANLTVPGTLMVTGDVQIGSFSAPRGIAGKQASTTSSAAIGTTETVIFTITNLVFKAGRAYKVTVGRLLQQNTVGAAALFRVRKTNAGGTDWGIVGRILCADTTVAVTAQCLGYLLRTAGTDLTTDVALTLQAGVGTATQVATATEPRFFLIEDVGTAADFANLGVAVT